MALSTLDLVIIGGYVLFALVVGSLFFKKASEGSAGFFVGDRKLPWWVAGTSIVATTFAADTPLAVAGIVGSSGIAGNWIWWCWAFAHLIATFFFAKLWRRSGVITDAEITELRYSGKAAAALRAFKAVYYGLFINCLTMAWVILAMVKISGAFFPDVEPVVVIAVCICTSVLYTSLGGFRGVVITDLVQFALGMIGAIALAYYALSSFDGIGTLADAEPALHSIPSGAEWTAPAENTSLLQRLADTTVENGKALAHTTDFVPDEGHPITPIYFLVLLIAGWWRNAEGNGYLVQRLAATKDEGHAQAASLWFSIAHNALRPWPWILVGLAALVFYPNLSARPGSEVQGILYAEAHKEAVFASPAIFAKDQPISIAFRGLQHHDCGAELNGQFVKLETQNDIVTATFAPMSEDFLGPMRVDCDHGSAWFQGLQIGELPKSLTFKKDALQVKVQPAQLDVIKGGTLTLEAKGLELHDKCLLTVGMPTPVDQENARLKNEGRLQTQGLTKGADGKFAATFDTFKDARSGTQYAPLFLACNGEPYGLALGTLRVELTDREMGYPLMMKRALPAGWLGLVIASLLAAFMSTIDTHTNWGASYMVQDLYRRFIHDDKSEAHYVMVSRISIVGMAILAGVASTFISSIAEVWGFLITLGAGLGSVSAARWYWHRVTPHAEFAAMAVTTVLALGLEIGDAGLLNWQKIILVAVVSFCTWIPVALFGPQNDDETSRKFAEKVRPSGPGWKAWVQGEKDSLAKAAGRFVLGALSVFGALFGIGKLLFGDTLVGVGFCVMAAVSLALILQLSKSESMK